MNPSLPSKQTNQPDPPCVVIAGGGTGGHLFPGLAVAEQLRQQGVQVVFVGTARGLEAKIVPQYGYPLHLIDVSGLKRQGLFGTLRSVLRLPKSAWQARTLLHTLRPQAVLSVGGYASGPVALLAAWMGIPTAVMEQNAIPGMANRWVSRWARTVFTAFPQAASWFPHARVEQVGTPIRHTLLQTPAVPRPPGAPLRLLILGGSQGAHAVNERVLSALQHWAQHAPHTLPQVVHQTGIADEAWARQTYAATGISAEQVCVTPFIENMAEAYARADLVIGRAGATTLAELTALGLPALLIPLPSAADDHQTHNARFLVEAGAARMLPQAQTTGHELVQLVQELQDHPDQLAAMAQASLALGKPHAAKTIADALISWTTLYGTR